MLLRAVDVDWELPARLLPKMGAKVGGIAPNKPNAYSDGSLKHNKGHFWQVGGAGVWWPGRSKETLTKEEKGVAEYEEVQGPVDIFDPEAEKGRDGVMLWCPFNSRLNSSTRCELGAATVPCQHWY